MKRVRLSRRFRAFSTLLFVFLVAFPSVIRAQSTPDQTQPAPSAASSIQSAESLKSRIERARALIAAHRLDTAASELESVRAATQDSAVRTITSIMLMSVYLEEGNYARAEALLEENFKTRSAQNDEPAGTYFALAGQAVNGARTHLARYRSFGINTSDANLPAEAASDLSRLRSLLERMIAQAKEISNGRRYDSLSLLEDVLGIRLSLAVDSEDQVKWEAEYANAREVLASSQTQIASLGKIPPLRPAQSPVNKNASSASPYSTKRGSETPLEIKSPARTEPRATAPVTTPEPTADASPGSNGSGKQPEVSNAGSLNAKATKRVLPRYPTIAKQSGAAGLVRVHVIVDENGKVVAVSRSEGPMLLRRAAEEAALQWSFPANTSGGAPTRLSGYIDFNFTL